MNPDAIGPSLAHPKTCIILRHRSGRSYYKRYVVEKEGGDIFPPKNHHSGIDLRGKKGSPFSLLLMERFYRS